MNGLLLFAYGIFCVMVTLLWEAYRHRSRELRHHREMCNHVWGEVVPVVLGLTGQPAGHKQWCPACGRQKDVFWNGDDYVPRTRRIEGKVYPDDPQWGQDD